MILGLHTATPICKIVIDGKEYIWEAHRELAKGLLGYLETCLKAEEKTFGDIDGLIVFKGPGSFTGLRIGITVMNTIADANKVAIVGTEGAGWYEQGVKRLQGGEDDRIVLPHYGSDANITQPRK